MAEENQSKFSIIKLIPATLGIAILTQFSILSYYNYYNFSPITYFESYEIVVASAKDFIIIGIIIFVLGQLLILGASLYTRREISKGIKRTIIQSRNERIKLTKQYYYMTVIFIPLLISTFYISDNNASDMIVLRVIFLLLIFSCLIMGNTLIFEALIIFRDFNAEETRKYFPYIQPVMLLGIVGTITIIMLITSNKYVYIKRHNPYKGTELHLENETIKCTSKVIFIGKSQKYYFIYNTPDKSVRVVKRDDLKKEVIKIDPNVNFFYRF